MRRHNRLVRLRLQPHGDSMCSSFRYLSSIDQLCHPDRGNSINAESAKDKTQRNANPETGTSPRTPRKRLRSGPDKSPHRLLSLNRKQEWLLEGFRDPAQKARGVGAIDQPVIVRE